MDPSASSNATTCARVAPVPLDGGDDGSVGDRERVGEEAAGIRGPPDGAGGDVDRVHRARVVAQERGIAVDGDAGATDLVELHRGVPHRLRVSRDRSRPRANRTNRHRIPSPATVKTTGSMSTQATGSPCFRAGCRRSPPCRSGCAAWTFRRWPARRTGRSRDPRSRALARSRGRPRRSNPRLTAMTEDPSTTGCESPNAAFGPPRGTSRCHDATYGGCAASLENPVSAASPWNWVQPSTSRINCAEAVAIRRACPPATSVKRRTALVNKRRRRAGTCSGSRKAAPF